MYDPKRIPIILDALKEVWEMIPTKQFTAIIFSISRRNSGYWDINDQEFIEKLAEFKSLIKKNNAKTDELLKQL